MKINILLVVIGIFIIVNAIYNSTKANNKTSFTITPDTKIDPNSKLAKYITQEEVDNFSFRCADIVCDEEKNTTLIPLRNALDSKDTNKVLNFIKDNNISVDVRLRDKRTPLMYSSFRNDVNTTKELIKLGADIRAKDVYGLTPLAYAIMLDSLDTTKVLLDSGVKFEEVEFISPYILRPWDEQYEKIIIDGDKVEMVFKDKSLDTNISNPQCYRHCSHDKTYGVFRYVLRNNSLQMAELMLKSGYKPTIYFGNMFRRPSNNYDDIVPKEQQEDINKEYIKFLSTHYKELLYLPEHKDMLELMLKYDVAGQPSKDLLKYSYERCYRNYIENVFILNYDVDNDGKYYLKNYDLDSRIYEKYCSEYNKTFDIKEFFAYSSEIKKSYDIFQALRDKNVQKIFLDKNQTKIIVHPYKEHSSDEIKKIVDGYYHQPIGIKDFDNIK